MDQKVHLGEREGLAKLERRGMSVAEGVSGRDGGGQAFLVTGFLNLARESEILRAVGAVKGVKERGHSLGGGAWRRSQHKFRNR